MSIPDFPIFGQIGNRGFPYRIPAGIPDFRPNRESELGERPGELEFKVGDFRVCSLRLPLAVTVRIQELEADSDTARIYAAQVRALTYVQASMGCRLGVTPVAAAGSLLLPVVTWSLVLVVLLVTSSCQSLGRGNFQVERELSSLQRAGGVAPSRSRPGPMAGSRCVGPTPPRGRGPRVSATLPGARSLLLPSCQC
jgi:hypothetical protein